MRRAIFRRMGAPALLLVCFGLLVFSVQMKSPTADEQNHIARGLAYLRTGDLRLSQEHPPGANAWEAWPLLLDPSIVLPLDSPSWADGEWYGFADQLLWQANDRPQAMVFATRVPVMWLTLILAALVYRWGKELAGEGLGKKRAGLLAMALVVLEPNLLAHGRLTTTDMAVTCLSYAAMYSLWRALRADPRPAWGRWAAVGTILGLALLTKFSALVLLPVMVLILALAVVVRARGPYLHGRAAQVSKEHLGTTDQSTTLLFAESVPVGLPGRVARDDRRRWLLLLFLLAIACALVVWAGYRFTWGPISLLGGLSGPAPAYWAGIETILRRTGGGSTAFLAGRVSETGWWYYFPVAFLLKTPLPTLFLLLLSRGRWAWRWVRGRTVKPRLMPLDWLCLGLPALAFWGMALAGGFNIGYRHVLPSLPLLYTLAGVWLGDVLHFRAGENPRTGSAGSPALACGASDQPAEEGGTRRGAVVGLYTCPGIAARCRGARPTRGLHSYLVVGLLAWLAVSTLSIAPDYLAFFNLFAGGPAGGYRYLVDSNLDWGQDLPGLARYVEQQGLDRIYLSWFGAAHPEAYGFDFAPLPGFWRFRSDPLSYGFNPLGPQPGLYAISATNLQGIKLADPDTYAWFLEREPDDSIGHSILLYRVERPAPDRALVVGVPGADLLMEERAFLAAGVSVRTYDPATGIVLPLSLAAEQVWYVSPQSPSGSIVRRRLDRYQVFQLPPEPALPAAIASFGSHVQLVRLTVGEVDQGALVVSADWLVDEPPYRAAVSFVHLLDTAGHYVAGWDGLTAPATCWQSGDLVRQEYRIALPADLSAGRYRLEVGWYDASTVTRWPCTVDGELVGDRFLAPGLEVTP